MINNLYIDRISKVIDYIEVNIDTKLRLDELADIAMFSKYHFHRIFKNITGETLNDFIKRLKMIKAYRLLKIDKAITIKELTYSLGYNSIANFSRDFKYFHGLSPLEIKSPSVVIEERVMRNDYNAPNIEYKGIEKIPDTFVLYKKITTGYCPESISKTFDDLYRIALDYNFIITQFVGIGYDDPDYTPANKCKYDACIAVNNDIPKSIPCNSKSLKGGLYAVFYFEGYKNDISSAWDYIFKEWLLNSNYIPTDRPHLEMYLHSEHYELGFYNVNLCLPIKSINK
ncbi:MAG: AraC family transcriptional regulator [Bacteroidales bacterium]